MTTPPEFDPAFRDQLDDLFRWRRDVRRFRPDPVAPELLDELLDLACLAPSVGNSQPWRFVRVDDVSRRAFITEDFRQANAEALAEYEGSKARLYASLKLSGLQEAPVHLAVFADEATDAGSGLGRRTMPEMLRYSAVLAVHTLWLAARSRHLGIGWVSIVNPDTVADILDVPPDWKLVAYLCIGHPQEEHDDPELKRHGWQDTDPAARDVLIR